MAADLDMDGDMDLVGGNLGLNSMLKASVKEPVELYLNDFDNNGIPDPIICAYRNGTSYPVATLDELKRQIIGIEKRYPTYAGFGGQTAIDIFGQEKIAQSIHKQAVQFESAVFINNGNGTFTSRPLPVEAQFSPVRALLARDFSLDGIPDLLLAGNNYATRPSLGRQDASQGWLLLGNSTSDFRTLMPVKSGFCVTGDARNMHLIEIEDKTLIILLPNNGEIQLLSVRK